MATIHFIGGEKGGVGKSFTARLLAQYLLHKSQEIHGFDSDQSHASFSRFYGEYCQSVDTDSFESLDMIIDYAEHHQHQHLIIDLAAQTERYLDKWLFESDIFHLLKELGYSIYVWQVMDDGVDSLSMMVKMMDKIENQPVQLLVVENYGRGGEFSLAEQAHQVMNDRGVKVLTVDSLHKSLSKKMDFSNTSFWAAANNRDAMSLVQRSRIKTWLNKHYEQFDNLLLEDIQPQPEYQQEDY